MIDHAPGYEVPTRQVRRQSATPVSGRYNLPWGLAEPGGGSPRLQPMLLD